MRATRLAAAAVGTILALTACQKRTTVNFPSPAPTPPPVTALERAERAFSAEDYTGAAEGYENYLRLAPAGDQRDQALFRLGLAYALRPAPGQDWQRAMTVLRQLVQEYPNSPFKSAANLVLSLRSEVDLRRSEEDSLRSAADSLRSEADSLRSEADSKRAEADSLRSQGDSLRSELDQAAAATKQRDERIRQLTTELERLKKIDADRKRSNSR